MVNIGRKTSLQMGERIKTNMIELSISFLIRETLYGRRWDEFLDEVRRKDWCLT